jgi:hypothetical protein
MWEAGAYNYVKTKTMICQKECGRCPSALIFDVTLSPSKTRTLRQYIRELPVNLNVLTSIARAGALAIDLSKLSLYQSFQIINAICSHQNLTKSNKIFSLTP